jgi:hypothetical protein
MGALEERSHETSLREHVEGAAAIEEHEQIAQVLATTEVERGVVVAPCREGRP